MFSRYVRNKEQKNYIFEPVLQILTAFSQPAFTCSKLTIVTLQQGVKYVES